MSTIKQYSSYIDEPEPTRRIPHLSDAPAQIPNCSDETLKCAQDLAAEVVLQYIDAIESISKVWGLNDALAANILLEVNNRVMPILVRDFVLEDLRSSGLAPTRG